MFSLALESMQASVKSKLGSELEALFQEVIDYRDKNLEDVNFDSKVQAICTYFQKNVAKRMMDIVWKNAGLYIAGIEFKPHFRSSFCTWMCYGHTAPKTQNGTFQIENILNGQANGFVGDLFASKEFTVDELIKIAMSFDVEKGIIKPQFRKDMKKWIQCGIGFDIALGFLAKDYLPKNAGVEYLTARELTAIMLHEIGHNMNLIEHAADMYAHVSAFNALRTYAEKRCTPQQAIELGKYAVAYGTQAGLNKEASRLAGIIESSTKDLASCGKQQLDPTGKNCFVLSMICSAFELLGEAMHIICDIAIADPTRWTFRMSQNKKVGDTIIHDRMWQWEERHADEYAMLNGYGADQVTSLEKIMKVYSLLGRSAKEVEQMQHAERTRQKLSLFSKIHLFSVAHCMLDSPMYMLYPPGSQRYREILKSTIQNLKKFGADAAYVTKYMKDIETILDSIDKMSREDKYLELSMERYKVFMKFTSLGSILSWLTHGRVDTELVELLNDIQKLNANLLSYFAVKFQQLAKKA